MHVKETTREFKSLWHLLTLYLLSPRLCFFIVLNRDLFVYRDDLLTS